MDPVPELPSSLPPHDYAPLSAVPHQVIAEWPAGNFVENLVTLEDGGVLVSVVSLARIDRVAPDGAVSTLRQFDAPPTGLALADGSLFAAVGEPGAGEPALWRLDPHTGAGEVWMPLTGMKFANGVTNFAPGQLMITDSWHGALMLVDISARKVSVWFQDIHLTRAPGFDFLPGANGVKRFGDHVTVSSTGRALLLRVAVQADGSAGPLGVLSERLRVDDLAFDVDGAAYLTTHIGHSLDRFSPDGARITLAGPEQGMAGSTACAFGSGSHDRSSLYVTTTGGIFGPHNKMLQPAKLVRLDVGVVGHPLSTAWETAR